VQFLRDPVAFHDDYVREHGDVVRVDVGGRPFHYVTHPHDVERVLVDDHDRFRKASILRETSGGYLGDGLFFAEGEQWRRQRTLTGPAFYREAVERYAGVAVEHARDLAESWDDGERVRVDEASKELALSILTRALFGLDVREDREAGRVVREAATALNDRLDATRPATYLPNWVPTPTDRRFERASEAFDALVDRLVAERRGEGDSGGGVDGNDLLSFLLRAHDAGDLSERELHDGLMTFLFAGHETTSLAMTYTWYLLAENPDVETRLHAELDALGRDPVPSDLPELTYTDAVIKESMRLYPPAYMVLREPVEDVTLGGYRVPEGATLILPQRVVHIDPRWWEDPTEFRPGRWLSDAERPEYAYFPFGGGPRRCIGARFSTLELKSVLSTMARRVRLEDGPDGLPLSFAVTLQPGTDVEMTVRRR
jgi:cytochrome P450